MSAYSILAGLRYRGVEETEARALCRAFKGGAYQSHSKPASCLARVAGVGVLADVAKLTANNSRPVAGRARTVLGSAATGADRPVDQAVAVTAAVLDPGAHDCEGGGCGGGGVGLGLLKKA